MRSSHEHHRSFRGDLGGAKGEAGEKDGRVMWLSGLLSGCVGYFLGSPLFLVKTRLQAEAGAVGADGLYATGARAGHAPSLRDAMAMTGRCAFGTIWKS